MANITVKVDDLTGDIIRKGDFVAEISAEVNGQELRWDLGRASYALFMERMEPFLRCAQVIRGAPIVETPIVEQPTLFDPLLTLVATPEADPTTDTDPEPEPQYEPEPRKHTGSHAPRNYPKVRATKKLLFSTQNLAKLEEANGRSVLLLRGASMGNFSRQRARALYFGISLSRKNIRTARSYTLPNGATAQYRICDIYGRKL